MSIFTTPVAAVGLILGLYFVTLMWLQRDLRLKLSGKVRILMVTAFGILPISAVGIFWSAIAVAIALVTAVVVGVLAFICYDAYARAQEGYPFPRWLNWL